MAIRLDQATALLHAHYEEMEKSMMMQGEASAAREPTVEEVKMSAKVEGARVEARLICEHVGHRVAQRMRRLSSDAADLGGGTPSKKLAAGDPTAEELDKILAELDDMRLLLAQARPALDALAQAKIEQKMLGQGSGG